MMGGQGGTAEVVVPANKCGLIIGKGKIIIIILLISVLFYRNCCILSFYFTY